MDPKHNIGEEGCKGPQPQATNHNPCTTDVTPPNGTHKGGNTMSNNTDENLTFSTSQKVFNPSKWKATQIVALTTSLRWSGRFSV